MLKQILQKLYTIEHLPSHPRIKKKANELLLTTDLNSDDGIDNLANFISYDPSLSMELLKIANSDAYGFKYKISSIKHALLILDNDLIRLIIEQHPSIPDLEIYDARVEKEFIKLLMHSIEVHEIAGRIINYLSDKMIIEKKIHDDILSAAVIHDIGFYFILSYFPDRYFDIIDRIRTFEKTSNKTDIIKLPDHSTIGSILGEYWHIPTFIKTAIAFHHYPWAQNRDDKNFSIGAEILYISDCLSNTFYSIYYNENDIFTINENIILRKNLLGIMEKLGLAITLIPEIRNRTEEKVQGVYEKLGLNFPAS